MRAIHEDSDGTGYCRDCGTTIGEEHHRGCYLNDGIQCVEDEMSDVAKIVEELNHVRYLLQGPATAQVSMDIAKSIDAVLPLAQRLEAVLPAVISALKFYARDGNTADQALSLLQAEKKI